MKQVWIVRKLATGAKHGKTWDQNQVLENMQLMPSEVKRAQDISQLFWIYTYGQSVSCDKFIAHVRGASFFHHLCNSENEKYFLSSVKIQIVQFSSYLCTQ